MSGTCKMLVPTQPGVGDEDRSPPPHRCKRPVYADGYCATHNPQCQQRRKAEKAERVARHTDLSKVEIADPIDAAIVLLVKNGYRVEKLPAPPLDTCGNGRIFGD
jgi:hypothetical protein